MSDQTLCVDSLLLGGSVITMDGKRHIFHNAAVAVKDSKIVWIGSREEAEGSIHARQNYDVNGKVITPGLINTHGHWAMTLFRGLVDDKPLEAWLEEVWEVERVYTTPGNVAVGAQLAIVEMIRSGTTCAADMYWQFDSTTCAARKAGFRIVNGPSYAKISGFDEMTNATSERALDYLDQYRDDPLVHLCVQTHAVYTTDYEIMEKVKNIAAERDILFITHASESRAENENVRSTFGKTPIGVLDSVGLLGKKTLLAHCVHLTEAEIERLSETGASVSHCPSSNLKIGNGIARVSDMLKAGVNVSIGTDGPATNNDLDILHEAQLAALLQKGATGDPTVLPAEKVMEMLTVDGASALGLADKIGSIETGKLADLVVFDFNAANLTPCYDYYSHLVYSASAADVSDVMINGQMVMLNRELLYLDEEKIKADVRAIAHQIQTK